MQRPPGPLSLTCHLLLLLNSASFAYNVCEYGDDPTRVARTCREIAAKNQYCIHESGSRLIDCGDEAGETHQVYCDMAHMGGGWERVINLNFTASDPCPVGSTWMPVSVDGVSYCSTIDGYQVASLVLDPTCSFSEISGYVLADQKGKMDGFFPGLGESPTLDDPYVDGVSITLGNTSSTRQHVFTYAIGRDELPRIESCPCLGSPVSVVPYFVGYDFHCDSVYAPYTANTENIGSRSLWSGEGCGEGSLCCNSADTPWFFHVLPQTARGQPLEVRILSNAASHNEETILVREIEILVR